LEWCQQFKYDAIKPLMESGNEAVKYFGRRDLLPEDVGPAPSTGRSNKKDYRNTMVR
jgi:hypothetical protein